MPIVNKQEYSALNKMERILDGVMIKDVCLKLSITRIGETMVNRENQKYDF